MKLTTEADLAEQFEIEPEKAADLRKRQGWPHVRLTRFDVRYTDAQIEQIIASRSVAGERALEVAAESGLTQRSARRSA